MVRFHTDAYTFLVDVGKKPENFSRWIERSSYSDLNGLNNEGAPIYIGVEEADKWEMMIIAFNVDAIRDSFFHPELFYAPETKTLFVGAGNKAMTYSLRDKAKVSDRSLALGIWYWAKHDNFIVLIEELELAVYDYAGNFIWQTRSEPPWSYGVQGNTLTLDVMNNISQYELDTGRPIK